MNVSDRTLELLATVSACMRSRERAHYWFSCVKDFGGDQRTSFQMCASGEYEEVERRIDNNVRYGWWRLPWK